MCGIFNTTRCWLTNKKEKKRKILAYLDARRSHKIGFGKYVSIKELLYSFIIGLFILVW